MSSANIEWKTLLANYSSTSATVFLLWDIIITVGDEVRLIWPKPNSFKAKWFFLFNRYFAVAFQLPLIFGHSGVAPPHYSRHVCLFWYIYEGLALQVLIASAEVVLIMRVRALYLHNLIFTRTLYALFVLENICMTAALIFSVRGTTCYLIHTSPGLVYFAASFGAFETFLFILTLAKSARLLYSNWRDTPFLTVLVRDGTWAFALIFAALCVNLGFYLGAPDGMAGAAVQWLLSIESFASARLALNMLALNTRCSDDSDPDGNGITIQFAEVTLRQNEDEQRTSRWETADTMDVCESSPHNASAGALTLEGDSIPQHTRIEERTQDSAV